MDMFSDYAGRYRLICCDPAWRYQNFGLKGHGAVRAHYPTLTIGQMMRMPVAQLAHPEGSALIMWATCTVVAEGGHAKLMRAWGYRPVTELFRWRKVYDKCRCGHRSDQHPRARDPLGGDLGAPCMGKRRGGSCRCIDYVARPYCGLGFYTRSSGESAFLGLRGSMTGEADDVRQEIEAPVLEHSRKPDEVFSRIARLWPRVRDGERLEMFGRRGRPGWDMWGRDEEGALVPGAVDVFAGLMDPALLTDESADVDRFIAWLAAECRHTPPCSSVTPRTRCVRAWRDHVARQAVSVSA